MGKSFAKRQRNGFVRMVRAETAINCLSRALGYAMTRDRETAILLIRHDLDHARAELEEAAEKHLEKKREFAARRG